MGMESESNFLITACIFFGAAAFTVPIANKVGLGSILGYLLAGILIGPFGLKVISNPDEVLRFSEFGVVLMLFLIGLGLEPARLWRMRRAVFGMGAAQVLLTIAGLAVAAYCLGLPWLQALAVGIALTQSSTAIGIQLMQERKILNTSAGQSSFAILLFQDISVIPKLAVLPMLGYTVLNPDENQNELMHAGEVVLVIAGIILAGRFLSRPLFRLMVQYGNREIFTALSLFIVIGIALLMDSIGLSMALGTFLAGVVLAESEYRHELEISVEPFKALLLGLFFISVGMSMDLALFASKPLMFFGLTLGIVLIKFLIQYFLGFRFGMTPKDALFAALMVSPAGEFALVLLGFSVQFQVIQLPLSQSLSLTVGLCMITTPLLMRLYDYKLGSWQEASLTPPEEEIPKEVVSHPVIVAGCGRFGQLIVRLLHAMGTPAVVLDNDHNHVDVLRKFGFKVYYGDPTRLETLRAAGAEQSTFLIICIDSRESADEMIRLAQRHFPHLKIYCRARDRHHAFHLIQNKVHFERETFESSLKLGEKILIGMGFGEERARMAVMKFRHHDLELLARQAEVSEDQAYGMAASSAEVKTLEDLFKKDDLFHSKEEENL